MGWHLGKTGAWGAGVRHPEGQWGALRGWAEAARRRQGCRAHSFPPQLPLAALHRDPSSIPAKDLEKDVF